MFNVSSAQMYRKERVKDSLRKAEQDRLTRGAENPKKERNWRQQAALLLKSPLVIFTGNRVDKPRRQSPSVA